MLVTLKWHLVFPTAHFWTCLLSELWNITHHLVHHDSEARDNLDGLLLMALLHPDYLEWEPVDIATCALDIVSRDFHINNENYDSSSFLLKQPSDGNISVLRDWLEQLYADLPGVLAIPNIPSQPDINTELMIGSPDKRDELVAVNALYLQYALKAIHSSAPIKNSPINSCQDNHHVVHTKK